MCSESLDSLCIPRRTGFDISIKGDEIVPAGVRVYCPIKSQRKRGEFIKSVINMSHCCTYVTACGGISMEESVDDSSGLRLLGAHDNYAT